MPEQGSQIVQIALTQTHTNLVIPELQRSIGLPDDQKGFASCLIELWLPALNEREQGHQLGWM
jgi:hypothetical protein